MTIRNFTLFFIVVFCSSLYAGPPNLITGEGCEKLGLTGELRPIAVINPAEVFTGLSMDEVLAACTPNSRALIWGCYKPIEHEIYVYWGGGKRTLYEEQCHSIGFTQHIETADWVLENKARNDYAMRHNRSLKD